ncbi:MAG TPA: hypothetical protein VK915_00240 [Gaiellaceae bacterium]|nr:hypothetical protein [Gaiellaceae bacterium]
MRSTAPALVLAVLGLALAGCYSEQPVSGEGLTGAADYEPAVEQEQGEPAFRGRAAERYRDSYRVCSAFGPKEVAAQLGSAKKPRAAARAHAKARYASRFFRPAFRGCVDAFHGRDPAV